MELRLFSDIHLEFADRDLWEFNKLIPVTHQDKDRICILAGDIIPFREYDYEPVKFVDFFSHVSDSFKDVLWVAGNHEWYGDRFEDSVQVIADLVAADFPNVRLIQDGSYRVGKHKFIAATLWTDLKGRNPMVEMETLGMMNDFSQIRDFTIDKWYGSNEMSRKFIMEELDADDDATNIVITHHAPAEKSIHEKFAAAGNINYAYVNTGLEDSLKKVKNRPVLWVHGHSHHYFDYDMDGTRVVCNARGYIRDYRQTSDRYECQNSHRPGLVLEV